MEGVQAVLIGADLRRFPDECTQGWTNPPCYLSLTDTWLQIITALTHTHFNKEVDISEASSCISAFPMREAV